jgi:flagellar hook assembly protein FlgD
MVIPSEFKLHQNYPNPFNPTTKIKYELPKESFVSINIYDLKGAKIKSLVNSKQSAGYKEILWNGLNSSGSKLPAGLYFLTIQTEEYYNSKKMILLK